MSVKSNIRQLYSNLGGDSKACFKDIEDWVDDVDQAIEGDSGGGSGNTPVFSFTYTIGEPVDGGQHETDCYVTLDKTASEILEAAESGMIVVAREVFGEKMLPPPMFLDDIFASEHEIYFKKYEVFDNTLFRYFLVINYGENPYSYYYYIPVLSTDKSDE